jgi:glycosyltransferase involved in cell wall biosynthesis
VWQDAEQPIRIRFEHTRFAHWGVHSGYVQLVRTLDPERFLTSLHGAADSDADFPRWLGPLRPRLRRFVARGGMPWYKLSDLNAELRAFAACLGRRVDIVHFLDGEHSGQFLPRLARLARLSSLRIIATFHQPPELARSLLNGELLGRLDEVVLVSPSQRPFFSQYVEHRRLHVILHGVDTEFFRPAAAPNQTRNIRCITTGHWLRNWKVFAAVAAAASDVAFDVVTGRNPDLGGLPNVRVLGGVDDVALAELYRGADILFLPLEQTTANNALLEGIASGLPVVATDLESLRAYLPNGEGILVPDNRVDGFLEALRTLQSNIALRQELGRRARTRAEALAWPRLTHRYEALYAQALRRPRAGSDR